MSDTQYNPLQHSVVQAVTGELYERWEATDFHEALLFAIAREIGRVHHNRYQKSWDRWSDDPHIPGIQWRSYIYNCDCPEDHDGFTPKHMEECRALQPNFQFEGVCFRWYKNPGRGMSINKQMTEGEWAAWFSRCMQKIREFDIRISSFDERALRPMPKSGDLESAQILFYWRKPCRPEIDEQLKELEESLGLKQDTEYCTSVLPSDPIARAATVRAIAFGIAAEKYRAQHEDRPSDNAWQAKRAAEALATIMGRVDDSGGSLMEPK